MHPKTCCFTGHRTLPKDSWKLRTLLLASLMRLVEEEGVLHFCSGGAMGFDLLAGETVLDLKPLYPALHLTMTLPCPGEQQTRGWPKKERLRHEALLAKADETVLVSPVYAKGCMHLRNRYLVDHSDYCLCYMTRFTGGTAYTVQYALGKDIPVENLAMRATEKA